MPTLEFYVDASGQTIARDEFNVIAGIDSIAAARCLADVHGLCRSSSTPIRAADLQALDYDWAVGTLSFNGRPVVVRHGAIAVAFWGRPEPAPPTGFSKIIILGGTTIITGMPGLPRSWCQQIRARV